MRIVLIAAAILLVVLIVGLKLIPPNLEPLTELYFDNHTMLPKAVPPTTNVTVYNESVFQSGKLFLVRLGGTADTLQTLELTNGPTTTFYDYATAMKSAVEAVKNTTTNKTVNVTYEIPVLRLVQERTRTYQPQSFSFALHNLEYQNVTYLYNVTATLDTRIVVPVQEGNITLSDNETVHIPIDFTIMQDYTRAKVQVELVGRNQTIHYWVTG